MEFTVKLRPVTVKQSEDSPLSVSGSDALYTELATLLRDENVDSEVVIDWIDVSPPCLSVLSSVLRHC